MILIFWYDVLITASKSYKLYYIKIGSFNCKYITLPLQAISRFCRHIKYLHTLKSEVQQTSYTIII